MRKNSPQKHPDGFVSVSVVSCEIGKIIYADRWQDIARTLRKRDDLIREYAAAIENGADPATIAVISSRLSAAKAAVRPGWVKHLIEADRLMTSDDLPLFRYRRDLPPRPVPKDRFAGDTEQHIHARQRMLLTGKIASDLVIVLERDLREALRQLQSPIERRERVLEKIEKAYRAAAEDHQWRPKGVTLQQERVLRELEEAAEELRLWEDLAPENEDLAPENKVDKQHQLDDQTRYEKALIKAIRAKLWNHPIVRAWFAARRSLGDWDELRRYRLKLETGVDKPMSKEDFWLAFEAHDLIDDGHKPEAIRKILIKKLKDPEPEDWDKWRDYFDLRPKDVERLIARLQQHSQQNFHKWLKHLKLF